MVTYFMVTVVLQDVAASVDSWLMTDCLQEIHQVVADSWKVKSHWGYSMLVTPHP